MPPKIDMYADSQHLKTETAVKPFEDEKKEETTMTKAAIDNASMKWRGYRPKTPTNRPKTPTSIANNYLSALDQSPRLTPKYSSKPQRAIASKYEVYSNFDAPIDEISAPIFSSASSVLSTASKGHRRNISLSADEINRIVDQRVNAHLMDIEVRMEGQLKRFMETLDQKIMARINRMEQRLDSIECANLNLD